jgi:hypothetical protein
MTTPKVVLTIVVNSTITIQVVVIITTPNVIITIVTREQVIPRVAKNILKNKKLRRRYANTAMRVEDFDTNQIIEQWQAIL